MIRIPWKRTKIHCHKRGGHGTHEYSYMLQQSCNPTLIQVAQLVGNEKFYQYFEAYGYTSKTGIDLPAEASPIFHNYSGFNSVELATYSFGQTFKITPIQQITAVSTVANGGYLLTPHVVSRITDNDGNVVYSADETPKRQVVSSGSARRLRKYLRKVFPETEALKTRMFRGIKLQLRPVLQSFVTCLTKTEILICE